jgi:hypothetical protein
VNNTQEFVLKIEGGANKAMLDRMNRSNSSASSNAECMTGREVIPSLKDVISPAADCNDTDETTEKKERVHSAIRVQNYQFKGGLL